MVHTTGAGGTSGQVTAVPSSPQYWAKIEGPGLLREARSGIPYQVCYMYTGQGENVKKP